MIEYIIKFTIVDFYLDWIKMYKISLNVLVCSPGLFQFLSSAIRGQCINVYILCQTY